MQCAAASGRPTASPGPASGCVSAWFLLQRSVGSAIADVLTIAAREPRGLTETPGPVPGQADAAPAPRRRRRGQACTDSAAAEPDGPWRSTPPRHSAEALGPEDDGAAHVAACRLGECCGG